MSRNSVERPLEKLERPSLQCFQQCDLILWRHFKSKVGNLDFSQFVGESAGTPCVSLLRVLSVSHTLRVLFVTTLYLSGVLHVQYVGAKLCSYNFCCYCSGIFTTARKAIKYLAYMQQSARHLMDIFLSSAIYMLVLHHVSVTGTLLCMSLHINEVLRGPIQHKVIFAKMPSVALSFRVHNMRKCVHNMCAPEA